jgi:23S rRNA (uracil1939-C5)-methyltransferase
MRITGLDSYGHGVGRLAGVEVSVPGALPGEQVEVDAPSHSRSVARLARVVVPSSHRVPPRCRHASECGGCSWQHVAYREQLRLKQERVQFLMDEALGTGRVFVAPTVPTPLEHDEDEAPWHFRNKAHFAFEEDAAGHLVMGHMRRGSRRVMNVLECPVHAEAGNGLAEVVRDAVARTRVPCGPPPQGLVRHLVVRVGRESREVLATLVVTRPDAELKRVSEDVMRSQRAPDGWHLNVHPLPGSQLFGRETHLIAGRERLRETVGGATFLVSATSFFQTNVAAAERLLGLVLEAAGRGNTRVLDLYAGLGLFAIPLALRGHEVVAVEENPVAVEDGEISAEANGIDPSRCRFIRSKVEYAIKRLTRRPFDAVLLDPPRTGAHAGALRAVRDQLRPARVVYVSCDPEVLARDLVELVAARDGAMKYRVASVTPVDMFPHTTLVESVAVLERA